MQRSRVTYTTGFWSASYTNGAGSSGSGTFPDYEETISESRRYYLDNSCNHVKVNHMYGYTVTGQSGMADNYPPWGVNDTPVYVTYTGMGMYPDNPHWSPFRSYWTGSDPDLHQCAANAYAAMRPTMATSASLTNFLVELRDLKQMFKLWDKHASLIKNGASGHLNWSFGWKPFLSDLKKIGKGIVEFEQRYDAFIKRAGLWQTRHYQEKLPTSTEYSSEGYSYSLEPKHKIQYVTTLTEHVFHAKMSYLYRLPAAPDGEMRARAFLDTLGLTLKPSQIWEMIPFSFLVDWFVNVGDLITNLDSDLLNPTMTIGSVLYSLKKRGTCNCLIRPFASTYPGNVQQVLASHHFSTYKRWFGVPVTTSMPEIDTSIHAGRVLLGTSLYITNKRR